ncbi:MAG: HD domain-containing protein [Deltaproteobacteria bacterium]|nr:HD domain-containing protein [Deltaproteobacteria bacterium]
MFNILVKMSSEQKAFLVTVKEAMEKYFATDQRRIDHALQVSLYAGELLAYIDADPVVTLATAYLHDIGIHESERKHGSNSGKWQELEGPPIAIEMLTDLGAEKAFKEQVAEIIANHHTRDGVKSPEFRVIWDADALVNFAEVLPSRSEDQRENILQDHMATEAGFRIARRIFITDTESHRRCLKGHRPAFLP